MTDVSTHRVTPLMRALLVAVAATVFLLAWFYIDSSREADDLGSRVDSLTGSLDARSAVIDELAAGLQAVREQLIAENIEPVVPAPSGTIREIIREVAVTGAQGPAGRDGRDGTDGITPACWFEAAQCVGPTGAQGDPGEDGVDGQDGADSTVPGPQGPAGANGSDGAPGPACPAGYEPRVIENGPQAGWIACAPTGAT